METGTTSAMSAVVVGAGEGRKLNVLGHSVSVKLTRAETAGRHYVVEIVSPPGAGVPPHVHDREDELIYVLEGEFLIMLGGRQFTVSAGAEIFFPRHVPHAFENVGTTPGRTLWTIVPGGNFEDFFEELAALPAGPPDPARVAAIFADYGMQILMPGKN